MRGRHEKRSAWRTLMVLTLAVLMAVTFMPAGTLAAVAESGTQQEASQSVDKTSPASGESGSAAAEQKAEEKAVNQGAQEAVKTADSQQSQLNSENRGGYAKF
ncbi:hypothetical protein [Eubacterium sp. F2]|uniref:hypothetical protein n=1 Tax=Eubacterium sp. F2 TaxID=3381348 RepID=UPI003908409C